METVIRCKICHSHALLTLKRYNAEDRLEPVARAIIARLHLPTPLIIHLVVCRKCGFVFYQNMLTLEEMRRFYKEEARYAKPAAHQLKMGRLWELEKMIKFLTRWLPSERVKTALDIGSGDFVALERVVQLHPHASYHAVDPSYPHRSHRGMRVFQTMVEDWQPSSQYDLVMLTHVLEHVGHLETFMKKVTQSMNDRGYLYVEIPFQVGPGLLLTRPDNIQHVNYFTPQSITNLLASHGLHVTKLEFDTTAYSKNGMPGMIRLLARKQQIGKRPFSGGLLPTLFYLTNPLYLVRSKLVGSSV